MLPKKNRITQKKDFEHMLKQSITINNKFFVVKYKPNHLDLSRFAFIISNKISKKAVERNKIRRRMREIIRTNIEFIPKGFDIIFLTKRNILSIDFPNLTKEIIQCLKSIK